MKGLAKQKAYVVNDPVLEKRGIKVDARMSMNHPLLIDILNK